MSKSLEASAPARVPGRPAIASALLGVDLGLRFFGFARVRSWMESGSETAAPDREPSPEDLATARALAAAVERAAGFRLYRVPCLPRALLLRRMLAGRGIPARLRIGVRREGGGLHAHAWVVCGTEALDPDPEVEERFPGLE